MFVIGPKKVVILAALSGAVIVTVFVSVALIRGMLSIHREASKAEAIADKNQHDIEQEFRQISPLRPVTVLQPGSFHKADHGIVSAAYKTAESYESIKLHYHRELTSRGWSFRKEVGVKYDGVDYGGKELIYCKNGYVAHLQSAGRQEGEFGWTFSFAMTWGSSDECM